MTQYNVGFGKKKYDCVVRDRSNDKPIIFYELKTFAKPRENLNTLTSYKGFRDDIVKLNNALIEHVDSRGFLIILYKTIDTKKEQLIPELDFIKESTLNNYRKWHTLVYNNNSIKLRPSRKVCIERVCISSWELV